MYTIIRPGFHPQTRTGKSRRIMNDSHSSLLERLLTTREQGSWERLVDMYTALLYFWACRAGLQGEEANRLVREVFDEVARKLSTLEGGKPPGGFRAWIHSLAQHQRRALLLGRPATGQPAEPPPPSTAANKMWEEEYVPFIVGRALELLQPEFEPNDWKACWASIVEGRAVEQITGELNMSQAEVFIAQSRVLRVLREELDGLLE